MGKALNVGEDETCVSSSPTAAYASGCGGHASKALNVGEEEETQVSSSSPTQRMCEHAEVRMGGERVKNGREGVKERPPTERKRMQKQNSSTKTSSKK